MNNRQFATTQWTLVWRAASEKNSEGRPALGEIVHRYWMPLYAFARHRGLCSEDAEDATQEFLGQVVQGDLLAKADPARGKFRTFLLTAWKRFLIDDYRKLHSQKRGGGRTHFSLNAQDCESKISAMAIQEPDAEQSFLYIWANSVLDEARRRVLAEAESRGKKQVCSALLPKLTMPMTNEEYAALSQVLSMSPTAVKVALHRLRQRFGELLREIVLETIDDPSDLDQEINDLLSAVRGQRSL